MASAANTNLPILYREIVPLSSNDHADWKARPLTRLDFLRGVHAIPLTVEEFVDAQRFYPIIFSIGDEPVPLGLMGLNEGVNVFVTDDGELNTDIYIPAYVRRYPYMLVRLREDSDELSLCFDPTAGAVGPDVEGAPLFEDGKPTEDTRQLLGFCEQFEGAGQRSVQFMQELKQHNLLMEGEVSIQPEGAEQPFVYRGFQMVDEAKLRELRGDVLRKMNQSGMLALIFAHLYSLQLLRVIFARQQMTIAAAQEAAAGAPDTAETAA
ncbi:MAG: SapC family protein [Sphingomonas fennica]